MLTYLLDKSIGWVIKYMWLHHWTHECKQIKFDLETGHAKTVKIDPKINSGKQCLGFGHSEKQLFGSKVNFALYKNGEKIFFSAGNKHWNTNDLNLEFRHSRPIPFISKFQIIEDGVCTFTFLYSHIIRSIFSIIDITYDQIDKDDDFYLEFVAENIFNNQWRTMAIKNW